MIKNCQQFEERIQSLMDSRIDPETDEAICAHATVCDSCNESLVGFSLLHTSYLNDSDSMKIKLDSLGLHEAMLRTTQERPNRKHLFAVAASISALVLVCISLTSQWLFPPTVNSIATGRLEPTAGIAVPVKNVSFESLARIQETLNKNEIYVSFSELPGLRPFKAIAYCLDLFQQSWFAPKASEPNVPDLGLQIDNDIRLKYSSFHTLAYRS